MDSGVIGRRYAKALAGLTKKDDLSKSSELLKALAGLFAENAEIQDLISDPKYGLAAKIKTVGAIATKLGANDLENRFLRFLTSQGRFATIGYVARSFGEQANQILGLAQAKLTLADELADSELDKIKQKLSKYSGKEIQLEVNIDSSILGGAVTQMGSLVLDGSVKNRLDRIKETISKG